MDGGGDRRDGRIDPEPASDERNGGAGERASERGGDGGRSPGNRPEGGFRVHLRCLPAAMASVIADWNEMA